MGEPTADPTRTGKREESKKSINIIYKDRELNFHNVTRVEETRAFVKVTTAIFGTRWYPIGDVKYVEEFDS